LQPDGKIVVVGTTTYRFPVFLFDTSDIAVARYNSDGTLDATFGAGGMITTNLAEVPIPIPPFTLPSADHAAGVALQPDGRIVVVGDTSDFSGRGSIPAIVRYNADGSLDSGFGPNHDGTVASSFASATVTSTGVAVAPSGRILVAGFATNAITFDTDFALIRYSADGTVDLPFGAGGLVTTDFFGMPDFGSAIAIQADGRIVIAGTSTNVIQPPTPPPPPPPPPRLTTLSASSGPDQDFAVVRYNVDGSLDGTFGTGGKVTTDLGSPIDAATSVALDHLGRIVVAGYTGRGSVDFAVVAYTANGVVDSGFAGGGAAVTDFSGDTDNALGVAVSADNGIVVVGSAAIATNEPALRPTEIAIARYAVDGSADSGFDVDGKVTTLFIGSGIDEAQAVAVQPDGKLVVAGNTRGVFGSDFALIRYNPDGSVDQTFGASGNGKVVTDIGSAGVCGRTGCGMSENTVAGLVLQPDGKIVVAGSSFDADAHAFQFALVRYLSNGDLDPTFGTGGIVKTDLAPLDRGFMRDNRAKALGLQHDGTIVVVGSTADLGPRGTGLDWGMARYNADGSLDASFGPNGDGTLIIDFGSDVGVTEQASAIAVQPDGGIVVVGSAGHGFPTVTQLIVARFDRQGMLDASFGSGGTTIFDFPFAGRTFIPRLAVGFKSDGHIVVMTDVGFDVFQFTRDGSLDPGFGVGGIATMDFNHAAAGTMALQADGHIVLGGTQTSVFVGIGDFAAARYLDDGSVDTTFGDNGEVTTNFGPRSFGSGMAIALYSNGDIVLAGGQNGDFAVAKYLGRSGPALPQ
jgi:uncharacterized delta-60 repeat protein